MECIIIIVIIVIAIIITNYAGSLFANYNSINEEITHTLKSGTQPKTHLIFQLI